MAQNILNTDYQMYGIFSAGDPQETIIKTAYDLYRVRRIVVLDRDVYQRILYRVQNLRLPIKVENWHMDPGNSGQAAQMKENALRIIGNQPVLVCCLHGQDRTGFLIASWLIKSGKAIPCKAVEGVKSKLNYGNGLSEQQLLNYNTVLGCQESTVTSEAVNISILANTILKIGKRKDINKLPVSSEILEDLHKVINYVLNGIQSKELNISEEKLKNYSDNLAKLCGMMIGDQEADYDEEEKLKTVLDIMQSDDTVVDCVRDNYDMQGGLSQGARGDSGPAGDNVRYFNYIDPEAERYPGGSVGTNIQARKRIWRALIKLNNDTLCKHCLRNPCSCDPPCSDPSCPLCGNNDNNAAFLGGGPQGSPTAEALPMGQGFVPSVGLHDNYSGVSSIMNAPSGTPGAPNGASPVMPAQPNMTS